MIWRGFGPGGAAGAASWGWVVLVLWSAVRNCRKAAGYGQDVACPAAGPDLGVQRGGAGDAVVAALLDVRLERVQDAGAAGGLDQQFFDAGGTGELGGGAAGQSQPPGDLADGAALGEQGLDRGVALQVAGHQPALVAVDVADPVGRGRPWGASGWRGGQLLARPASGSPQIRTLRENARVPDI